MGVDASYLYGYGLEIEDIEWDLEFLKEKYKNKLQEKISNHNWSITWGHFIDNIEDMINEEIEASEVLGDIIELVNINYTYNSEYLTFDINHLKKYSPNSKLNELDELAKSYAKDLGIKNTEDIKWIEFGYFS